MSVQHPWLWLCNRQQIKPRTQLLGKLIVVAKDLHDGVQHPEAHRDLRLDLVDPLLPRRRVLVDPLQIRLGDRPAAPGEPISSTSSHISFARAGRGRARADEMKSNSRNLLVLDREQFERVHDDRHAVRGADRLAVLDDPVHLVLGRRGLRECAYRCIAVTIALTTAIAVLITGAVSRLHTTHLAGGTAAAAQSHSACSCPGARDSPAATRRTACARARPPPSILPR